MLSLFFLFMSLNTSAELRPTDVLLEESVHLNSPLFSGGYDGFGGGDLIDVRKLTAWFYGERSIKTCFHVTQTFGLDSEKLKRLIEESANEWNQFFTEREINSHYKVPISTNFQVSERCSSEDDLVFYFGTGPISFNLNDLRARQLYIRPIAYVNKTDMSENFMWSRGYIRFIEPYRYLNHLGHLYPDWSNEQNTKQMISHELGHVLGFLHVPESIMNSQIAQNLFASDNHRLHEDSKDILFPSLNKKEYVLEDNQDSDWSFIKSISISNQTDELFIDSQKIKSVYKITDQRAPLLANIHQTEPLVFNHSRVIFFNYKGRSFTIENKKQSLEVREKGALIARALLKEQR